MQATVVHASDATADDGAAQRRVPSMTVRDGNAQSDAGHDHGKTE
jgi:hypothetical protein